jgi:nucleoid DNA-binding protein
VTKNKTAQNTLSRRTVLRRGALLSTSLGLALAAAPGQAVAMNKAELIEAMASEAGISKVDTTNVLDAFVNATTRALKEGDRVALAGFGLFSVSRRAKRAGGAGLADESAVAFDACPEFAAALDLVPGRGDTRRAEASFRCHNADVVIDAERIARETSRGRDSGLSKADAKRALDAFVSATAKALKKGDRVSLVGFGSFSISKRSARTGRNPQTGKEIKIAARNVVKFKAGAELSKAVN